uniref:Uncharacterized protein n=1 Tax=Bracon brevicornis TaxID=1563983 RepID=A0A6V7IJA1_9HYME
MQLECLGIENNLVRCIKDLVPLWKARITITSGEGQLISRVVQFRRVVFRGDSSSPLWFNISRMPQSVALQATCWCQAGTPGDRKHEIDYVHSMDDLKLFASGERQLNPLLDIVVRYSGSMGMEFALDKCAVLHIERRRIDGEGEDAQLMNGNVMKHLDIEGS